MTAPTKSRVPGAEAGGSALRASWTLPDDVTYLNHGSFGPSPRSVQQARQAWSERLEREPMDFFLRRMEGELDGAARRLGEFVGADPADLVFVDNATSAMNIVAASLRLEPGDEVLLTDQEYGAVDRLWERACRRAGASRVVLPLPRPPGTHEELAAAVLAGLTDRTRLLVVSHVTSRTATVLPVEEICRGARPRGVPVCIDGPHALAMRPLDLARLECDFYTASCHKWLSAPFGTGFLYAVAGRQETIEPAIVSWGHSAGGRPARWQDEFNWIGTRDPAGFLAVPAAIDFLAGSGVSEFRRRTHELARYARRRIVERTGLEPWAPDSPEWYGSMVALPLPPGAGPEPGPGQRDPLQDRLWSEHRIEVQVSRRAGERLLRVSCHLYNEGADVDRLVDALAAVGLDAAGPRRQA